LERDHVAESLQSFHQHLNAASPTDGPAAILTREQQSAVERRCPVCHAGVLRLVEWLSTDWILSHEQVHPPTFTPPSSSNNQGGHATRRPYLPLAPSRQRHWNIQSP